MNNKLNLVAFVLFLITFSQCSFEQNKAFTDKYDLNFDLKLKKSITWRSDPTSPFVFGQDITQTINDKHPMCFVQIKNGLNPLTLNGKIEQNILMPETKASSISIHLRCRNENLKVACLIISGLDERERVLYSDTLSILGSYGYVWEAFNTSVSKHNVALLHLSIEVEGINNLPNQRLDLDKIEITIDGKSINDFPQRTLPTISDMKNSDFIPLSFSDTNYYKKITALRERKIIAIGESIHGSETITEAAIQLIKYQVENNHCKLIILEQPIEIILRYNRFIQGDAQFKIENFTKDLSISSSSPRVIVGLLNWLKQYNEKAKDKVWLMGMDLSQYISNAHVAERLQSYIYLISQNKKCDLLDSLYSKLVKYESFPQALYILNKNKEIKNILGNNDFIILNYCLKMYIDTYKNNNKGFHIFRDKEMYSNVSFFLNLLCHGYDKAIIFAHFNHTNYLTVDTFLPYFKSLGSFMKMKFGRDYYNIAILTGEGSFMLRNKDSYFENKLETPPTNSLENMFMRTKIEYCFKPISTLQPQLTYMRSYGAFLNNEQFQIIAPTSRMDAAIFVRKSTGFVNIH